MTAGIVGKVPYVGPLLSIAVSIFWPNEGPSLWSQIEGQVANLIDQSIAQNNYQQLQDQLQGLENAVSGFLELTDPTEQQTSIEAIATLFAAARPTFMPGDPANNFSLCWSMAMLHMSVLRWRVTAWGLAQSSPPNLVPANDLQNAAISYALYGRVALSRIYNNRLAQLQVTQESFEVQGKAGEWECNFNIWDDKINSWAVAHIKRFNGWNPKEVNAFAKRGHEEVLDTWNKIATTTQNTLDTLACEHIETMEAQWPYTQSQALSLLSSGLFALPDFDTFQSTYYPSASMFFTPDVPPQQTTPQFPTGVPAPPPE